MTDGCFSVISPGAFYQKFTVLLLTHMFRHSSVLKNEQPQCKDE